MRTDIAAVRFGDRRLPRVLTALPCRDVTDSADIDAAIDAAGRLVVVGAEADLAAVLSRLLRADRLDIEVAHVPAGLHGGRAARQALRASAQKVPLIRDDTGTALVGAALWLPPEGAAAIHGEAVVDDTVLFDGDVTGLRLEPTRAMPGLRATVSGGRPRWVYGRAAQLGTTGARVVRDGVAGTREVKRSTFYRHTTGWMRVG